MKKSNTNNSKVKQKPRRKYQTKKQVKVFSPEKPQTTKEEYVSGYKELQVLWKTKDKELLLVGRLAYWTYWISKIAENCEAYTDNKTHFFMLKKNALILLSKSNYVEIKKYVPPFHKQMCYKHRAIAKKDKMKPLEFLEARSRIISECSKCNEGEEHYYTLYSIAVLNEKEDIEGRKPLFIMNTPYPIIKDEFPPLKSLDPIKNYYGNETCSISVEKLARNVNLDTFTNEFVVKYFTKNFVELSKYLELKK